ncbi:hypothetical protein C0J52_14005 [Blattella germanica]|nr:hypothetical protein C0J52_14005 [Blattella germanica]
MIHEPAVLIEGVLFRARYLGSTQLVCEGQPTKTTRMTQAEEAVSRIKVRLCFIMFAPHRCVFVRTQYSLYLSYYLSFWLALEPVGGLQDPSLHHVAGCPAGWPVESPPAPTQEEEEEEEEEEEVEDAPSGTGSGLAGTVFRLQFLGSVEVEEEGGRKRRKRLKKHMVEEAVTKIKV